MRTESIEIKRLELNKGQVEGLPKNPRFIRDEKFEKLKKSIQDDPEMLKIRELIVYPHNSKFVVIGGNMRLRAMKELGFDQAPCKVLPEDTPEKKLRAYTIKDNNQAGEDDFEILFSDWDSSELEEFGYDMPEDWEPETGPQQAKEDDYELPDPEEVQTNIKEGDIIEIGPHRLMCGDATNPEHAEKLMDGRAADLMVTDPPYNLDYKGGNGQKIRNDKQTDSAFLQFLIDSYKTMLASMKPGCPFYIFHADCEGYNFRRALKENGIDLRQTIIWVKNSIVMGRQDYQWKHEPILYGWKPGAGHYFIDDRSQSTVIDDKVDLKKMKKDELLKMLQEILFDKTKKSVIYHDKTMASAVHPTMKPVTLIGYLIGNSSKPGQTIIDFFGGSGSAMVACHQMTRRAYLMELDPKYCQVIIDRMQQLDPKLKVTINGEQA